MEKFNYNVSILIPVYNAQNTLEETLLSILTQQLVDDFKYEVLLINDGSVDDSEAVCLKYSNEYSHIKYFKHENRGVSYTRNRGLDLATGKYILFLDADDLISEDTLIENYLLFEENYYEADILSYPLYKYVDGEIMMHPRTALYVNSGVYDVDAFPHINQTSMNTMIKNRANKTYFDESMKFAEDTFFNIDLIMKHKKIILSSKGQYLYRMNSFSTVNLFKSPVRTAEYLVNSYLNLIDKYNVNGQIPKYIQSVILYEINWRMKFHGLYPRHLGEKEYAQWEKNYLKVMNFITTEVIMSHSQVDEYHKYYFINEKSEQRVQTYLNEKNINYVSDGKLIKSIAKLLLVFSKVKIKENKIMFEGFLKAPFLHGFKDLSLIVLNGEKQLELPLTYSSYSYYRAMEETNLFLGFEFDLDLTNTTLDFYVKIKDRIYNTTSYFQYNSILKEIMPYVVYKDYVLSVDKTTSLQINIKKQPLKKWIYKAKLNGKIAKSGYLLATLFKLLKMNLAKEIHLYNDASSRLEAGFEAFKKAHEENNKVKSYYVYDEGTPIQGFSDVDSDLYKYLVVNKSLKHKLLFLNAKKIITSSVNFRAYSAYNEKAFIYLNELFNYDVYWLKKYASRGISKKRYAREITGIDYVICEDKRDVETLQKYYGYKEEQILSENSSQISHQQNNNKSILIAFSWRNELFESNLDSFERVKKSKFANSGYHKNLLMFLNSAELQSLIDKGYKIDLYIHPYFQPYINLYNKIPYEVSIVKNLKTTENYSTLITDFSSLESEFIKNNKKVYHYLIDYNEFLCGNHYFKEVLYEDNACYIDYESLLSDIEK